MGTAFEVEPRDIEALTDVQLTELLRRLLLREAQKLGLPKARVAVALQIDAPDGGEDGRIEWIGGTEPTASNWLPHRVNLFQVKATNMTASKCGEEVLVEKKRGRSPKGVPKNQPRQLKPRVASIVERGGAYILFYGKPCEGQAVDDRTVEVRKSFETVAGKALADAVTVDVYGAEKIAEWANEHAAAVSYVLGCVGRNMPAAAQTWKEWQHEHQSMLTYYTDAARERISEALRQQLMQPRTVVRLAGLSGLGKSRLALEMCRPPSDKNAKPEQAALSAGIVYVGDGQDRGDEIADVLRALKRRNAEGIIVVDECPLELHRKLEKIVQASDSSLSLLTLDFEPDSDPHTTPFYKLGPLSNEDILGLLKASRVAVPDQHLAKVADLAQGFPLMAELMARDIEAGRTNLWECTPSDLIEKLVVRRSRNNQLILKVAKALAVFEHLGIAGDVRSQLQLFAQHFCHENVVQVDEVISDLENAGVVYRRGDYVRIRPVPIAVALAGEWWRACSTETVRQLIASGDIPPEMVEAMGNQLKRLADNGKVRGLVADLVAPTGPFRQRDSLDSAHGSRLMNFLAEVNPRAVCNALVSVFGSMSPDEARTVQEGRRNLVWCLEKLAWWPETFHDAAWLLLLFAAGENESWGNNAESQFATLFHVLLSGTEVPATERLTVLRRAVRAAEPAFDPLIVKAFAAAIESRHFIGGGGPEGGGLPRTDWQPRTYEEIRTYWRELLEIMKPYLDRNDELGQAAWRAFGENIRGMIQWQGLPVIEEVVQQYRAAWTGRREMLEGLQSAITYDGERYTEQLRRHVEDLITQILPTDLGSRLQLIVSTPSWHAARRDASGNLVPSGEEQARELARELAADSQGLLLHVDSLLAGEQRQGFVFGYELGLQLPNGFDVLEEAIARMRDIPVGSRNPSFLMGLASGVTQQDREKVRDRIHLLLDDSRLGDVAVQILLALRVTDDDVRMVADRIANGRLPVSLAQGFAFGGALMPISPEAVNQLIQACRSVNKGAIVAIDLLGMYVFQRPLDPALFDTVRSLLVEPGLLGHIQQVPFVQHHFAEVAKAYLSAKDDPDFVAAITERLVQSVALAFPASLTIEQLLLHILQNYVETAWPIVEAALSSQDTEAFRLRLTLDDKGLVNVIGDDRLLAWCEKDPEARRLVAHLLQPLQGKQPDVPFPSWSPLAVALLDRYGSERDVLSALTAKIYSGSWSGSAVPRLTQHRDAYLELKNHPNRDVQKWALEMVESLDAEIQHEKRRDEQKEFGIY